MTSNYTPQPRQYAYGQPRLSLGRHIANDFGSVRLSGDGTTYFILISDSAASDATFWLQRPACSTYEEANVFTPTAWFHEKDPKTFCYAGNTVYSEGATWSGKTYRRDNAVITPGVTNNLI